MTMMPQGPMQGQPMPPPMQMPSEEEIEEAKIIAEAVTWEEVSAILRSDDVRNYTIDVETDATSYEDDIEEKQARIEYVKAITEMMGFWGPAVQSNPSIAPFAKELVMFANGAFKTGRTMEESLEDSFDQIKNMPPQPDPEAEKAKMEMAMKEKELQGNMQLKQAETQMKGQELQQKLAFEQQKFEIEKQKMGMDLQFKQEEMAFKQREAEQNAQIQRENAARDQQMRDAEFQDKRAMAAHELQSREREFGLKSRESDAKLADMEERRKSDLATAQIGRDKEMGNAAMGARKEIEAGITGEITTALQQLAGSLDQAFVMVAEAVTAMAEQQAASTDTLATMAGYMMAPREIERDPKTNRPIGVKVNAGDLQGKLESLLAGRQRVAQEMNGLQAGA